MRINGFEQIKGFYSWVFDNQDKPIRSTHISLYMFLINQNNRNSWIEWFKCPFDLAMGGSGISNKKTYYTTLLDLQEWKLIEYRKGINNFKAPLIKIEVLFDTSTVPQCEPQLLPQVIPLPLPLLQPQLYNNIKLLTNNLELITINIKKVLTFLKEDKPKEEKKIEFYESVFLFQNEYNKLLEIYGIDLEIGFKILSNYKLSKGVKYKSDFHVMIGWVKDRIEKEKSSAKKEKQIKQLNSNR